MASGWKSQGKGKGVTRTTMSEERRRGKKSLGVFRELQAQVVAGPEKPEVVDRHTRKGPSGQAGSLDLCPQAMGSR